MSPLLDDPPSPVLCYLSTEAGLINQVSPGPFDVAQWPDLKYLPWYQNRGVSVGLKDGGSRPQLILIPLIVGRETGKWEGGRVEWLSCKKKGRRVILRRSNFRSGRRDYVAKVYCGVTLIDDHQWPCIRLDFVWFSLFRQAGGASVQTLTLLPWNSNFRIAC